MNLLPHPGARAALEAFRDEIIQVYPELVSLIAYGSALGEEFRSTHSNVNLLLVLPRVDAESLERGAAAFRRHREKDRILPLVLSEQELRDSVDVFAVEFLDIKERHVVLKGIDLFESLLIPGTWLRHQCEFELRGKLIRLRQGYLEGDGKDRHLVGLMVLVLSGVLPLCRSLLRLAGERAPHSSAELIQGVAKRHGLESRAWLEILGMKESRSTKPPRAANLIYQEFMTSLTALVGRIDASA